MSQKKIKNWAITQPASYYIGRTQEALIQHGAVGIQTMYDDQKRISALNFGLKFKEGNVVSFQLPCEWAKFQQVLLEQEAPRAGQDEYCYRVAWANIMDWVEAQMALYETQMVTMPQVFLPFATDSTGVTLFEKVQKSQLLLE